MNATASTEISTLSLTRRSSDLLRLRREQEPADDPDADQHREGVRLDAAVVQVTKHGAGGGRSEEHTSELQSRENLVCRLLLEKKKKNLTWCRLTLYVFYA